VGFPLAVVERGISWGNYGGNSKKGFEGQSFISFSKKAPLDHWVSVFSPEERVESRGGCESRRGF